MLSSKSPFRALLLFSLPLPKAQNFDGDFDDFALQFDPMIEPEGPMIISSEDVLDGPIPDMILGQPGLGRLIPPPGQKKKGLKLNDASPSKKGPGSGEISNKNPFVQYLGLGGPGGPSDGGPGGLFELLHPRNVLGLPGIFGPGPMMGPFRAGPGVTGSKKGPGPLLNVGDLMSQFPMHQSFVITSQGPGGPDGDMIEEFEIRGDPSSLSDVLPNNPFLQHFLGGGGSKKKKADLKGKVNSTAILVRDKKNKNFQPDPMLGAMMSMLMQSSDDLFRHLHEKSKKSDPCSNDVKNLCQKADTKIHCLGMKKDLIRSQECKNSIQNSVPFACAPEIEKFGCGDSNKMTVISDSDSAADLKKVEKAEESQNVLDCLAKHQTDKSLSTGCNSAVTATQATVQKFQTSKSGVSLVNKKTDEVHSVFPHRDKLKEELDMKWLMQVELCFVGGGIFLLLMIIGRILMGNPRNVQIYLYKLYRKMSSPKHRQTGDSYGAVM